MASNRSKMGSSADLVKTRDQVGDFHQQKIRKTSRKMGAPVATIELVPTRPLGTGSEDAYEILRGGKVIFRGTSICGNPHIFCVAISVTFSREYAKVGGLVAMFDLPGISSSQLTFIYFSEGGGSTTNQIPTIQQGWEIPYRTGPPSFL